MARVYLSIGSNIDRKKNIDACLDALSECFGELILSSVYESEAVGFEGEHFLNLVAGIDTGLSVGDLSARLRQIEYDNGRRRNGSRFSARTLDIDILVYDSLVGEVDGVELPRDEILLNAFVLQPLAEIAGQELHPQLRTSYAVLWRDYDKHRQKLWVVDYTWRGRAISQFFSG